MTLDTLACKLDRRRMSASRHFSAPIPLKILRYTLYRTGTKYRAGHSHERHLRVRRKKQVNKYPTAFRKMALERLKSRRNATELAAESGIHRTQLYKWRDQGDGSRIRTADPEQGRSTCGLSPAAGAPFPAKSSYRACLILRGQSTIQIERAALRVMVRAPASGLLSFESHSANVLAASAQMVMAIRPLVGYS